MATKFSKILWGDGLTVTPDPDDDSIIRVDSSGGGGGGTGPPGPTGPAGPPGADGVGVPPGGTDGQVLTKTSSTDFATDWETPSGGGGGGSSPSDTAGWMPLTTVLAGVPDLVWDATDSLIPTYGPF